MGIVDHSDFYYYLYLIENKINKKNESVWANQFA